MPKAITSCVTAISLALVSACGGTEPETESGVDAAKLAEYAALMDTTVAAARSTEGPGAPPIWTLSDEDTTIHFFGTFHILPPEADWRSPEFDAALDAAHTLVTETDTDSPESEAKMAAYFTEMMQADRPPLSELLSPSEYDIVETAAEEVGIPMISLEHMSPDWASLMISVTDSENQGYSGELGVETIAEAEAKAAGKAFGYLETIEFQMDLLTGLPMDEQIEMLVYGSAMIKEGREYSDVMLEEWLDGDVAGIGALIDPDVFGSDSIYDAMLTDRNLAWVPQIEGMLDEPGTILVAVGAAHLAGPDSVITMLRDKGYAVEGP